MLASWKKEDSARSDWVFKMDDDTWLSTAALARRVRATPDVATVLSGVCIVQVCALNAAGLYFGGFTMEAAGLKFASGGAGYLVSAATLSSIDLHAKCGWSHQYEDVGMAKCFKTALNLVPSHLDVNPDTPEKMIEWARKPSSDHRSKPTFIDPVTYHYIEANRMNHLAWRPGRNLPKRLHQFWLGPKPPPWHYLKVPTD